MPRSPKIAPPAIVRIVEKGRPSPVRIDEREIKDRANKM
jgi:hypothetical protein